MHGVIAVLRGEEEVNRKEYFVARKADYVDPNAPPPAEGVEELDDEIFDVVPFGYGMEFDEDKGEGENEVQAKRKQEEAEAAERGLAHAVSSLRTKVWSLSYFPPRKGLYFFFLSFFSHPSFRLEKNA